MAAERISKYREDAQELLAGEVERDERRGDNTHMNEKRISDEP